MKKFWIILAIVLAIVLVGGVVVSLLGGFGDFDSSDKDDKPSKTDKVTDSETEATETEGEKLVSLSGEWKITEINLYQDPMPYTEYYNYPEQMFDTYNYEFVSGGYDFGGAHYFCFADHNDEFGAFFERDGSPYFDIFASGVTITFDENTQVSEEFYTWFLRYAEPVSEEQAYVLSGTWKFTGSDANGIPEENAYTPATGTVYNGVSIPTLFSASCSTESKTGLNFMGEMGDLPGEVYLCGDGVSMGTPITAGLASMDYTITFTEPYTASEAFYEWFTARFEKQS